MENIDPWQPLRVNGFEFDYSANDPADPRGNSQAISIAQAQEIGEQCSTTNPIPDHIRIWTKDASEKRDPRSIVDGGDYVQTNVLIQSSSIFKNGATTAVLYIEGIGTSDSWGSDKIKIKATSITEIER